MSDQRSPHRPVIEMTIEGEFRDPPRPPVTNRVLAVAILVAVGAGALAVAAFALWLALALVPIAFLAAAVAYGALRWKLWRVQHSVGGRRQVFRP